MIALYKPCSRCNKKIEYNSKCKSCEGEIKKEKAETVRKYDREVRHSAANKKYTKFYHSLAWINLSEVIKLNFLGLCVLCAVENVNDRRKIQVTGSDTTHHIVELKESWDLRLVEENLIPLCHYHHNKIHANYCEDDKLYLRNTIIKFRELYL